MITSFFLLLVGLLVFLTMPFKLCLMIVAGFSLLGFSAVDAQVAQGGREQLAPVPAEDIPELIVPKLTVKRSTPLTIIMDINGVFILKGQRISEAELVTKLKTMVKADAQQKVILEADARAPQRVIANAMKILKSTGMKNVTSTAKVTLLPGGPVKSR